MSSPCKRLALTLLLMMPGYVPALHAQQPAASDPTLETRLARLEQLLNNQGLLQMLQQLDALHEEVKALRGLAETQGYELEQLKQRQRDLYADIDRRLQKLQAEAAVAVNGAEPPLATLTPNYDPLAGGDPLQAGASLTLELVERPPATAASPSSADGLTASGAGDSASAVIDTAPAAASQTQDRIAAAPLPDAGLPSSAPEPSLDSAADPAFGAATASPAPVRATVPALAPDSSPPQAVAMPDMDTATPIVTEPAVIDPNQAQADYRRAFRLLKQASYNQAVKAFRIFLQRYPDSEYADNAQFWLAEAYYVNSSFEQALTEYTNLVQGYPDSRKLAQAKLKAGLCLYELGQIEQARQQLEQLIRQHAGTTSAHLAQERLRQLSAPPQAETAPTAAAPG